MQCGANLDGISDMRRAVVMNQPNTQISSGIFISLGTQAIRLFLQLAGLAVYSRVLKPEVFGLFSIAILLSSFSQIFLDAGFSQAIIQREKINQELVSAVYWINVFVGVILCLFVSFCAPLVSLFFDDSRLTLLVILLSLPLIIVSFSLQHRALFHRQMRFVPVAISDVLSASCAFVAGVACASAGGGVWALVVHQLMLALVSSASLIVWSDWRPGKFCMATGLRETLSFGAHLSGFSIVNYLVRNADNFIIGKWMGMASLGFYTRAYQLLILPTQQIAGPLTPVVVSRLSRLQMDANAYRSFYLKSLERLALVTVPLVAWMILSAPMLVAVILGPEWGSVVKIFWALAPAALIGAVSVSGGWLYSSWGHVHVQFRWNIIVSIVTLLAFVIGSRFGVIGVALSFSISQIFLRVPGWLVCLRGTPVSFKSVLKALARPYGLSAATSLIVILLMGLPIPVTLPILSMTYIGVFLGLMSLFPDARAWWGIGCRWLLTNGKILYLNYLC